MNLGFLFQYVQGGYVLCKLKKKPDVKTTKSEPNHHMVSISDFEAATELQYWRRMRAFDGDA
jgi:hypothetical protein